MTHQLIKLNASLPIYETLPTAAEHHDQTVKFTWVKDDLALVFDSRYFNWKIFVSRSCVGWLFISDMMKGNAGFFGDAPVVTRLA